MNSPKVRVLVLLNPKASRAESRLPQLSSWFTERCHALIIVAKSTKEPSEGVRGARKGGGPDRNRGW